MFNLFLAGTTLSELFEEMFSFKNVVWNDVFKAINETLYMTLIPTCICYWISFRDSSFLNRKRAQSRK